MGREGLTVLKSILPCWWWQIALCFYQPDPHSSSLLTSLSQKLLTWASLGRGGWELALLRLHHSSEKLRSHSEGKDHRRECRVGTKLGPGQCQDQGHNIKGAVVWNSQQATNDRAAKRLSGQKSEACWVDLFHLALLPRPGLVLVAGLLDLVGEVEEDDVREPTKHQLLHLVRNLQQFFCASCFFYLFCHANSTTSAVKQKGSNILRQEKINFGGESPNLEESHVQSRGARYWTSLTMSHLAGFQF